MKASLSLSRRVALVVGRARAPLPSAPLLPSSALCDSLMSRCRFSSAKIHEHDKVREGTESAGGGVLDYWKAHKNERAVVDEAIDSVDYWTDHAESHVVAEPATQSNAAPHRSYSTTNGQANSWKAPSSAVEQKEGEVTDYWTNHNDTHYTDYWEEHDHSHT